MAELSGWLLDLYDDARDGGIVWWLLGDDGRRHCLRQRFPVTFYAAGANESLRALWRYLQSQPIRVACTRGERRELFDEETFPVIEIRVESAARQPGLFREVARRFPELDYYDADIPLSARFSAQYDIFPLTRCRVVVDEVNRVTSVASLESRWELDPQPPPVRSLYIQPDSDPFHALPRQILLQFSRASLLLPLKAERPLLVQLGAVLRSYDPDLILTRWGDTWLLPHLLELAERLGIPLPLNRDPDHAITRKAARSYYTYGTVIHRGQQTLLHGRCHIDGHNAMMFGDYGLEGVYELARVSGLGVQVAARNSPGSGITAMQVVTALRRGTLVPYQKQQTEDYKSAMDLVRMDKGGLVYQPLTGLHPDVAEIDFISMYPSIMRRFNISPETVGNQHLSEQQVRELRVFEHPGGPGLYTETLAPLLDKRVALKKRLAGLDRRDCRYQPIKRRSAALKWLLVVCFGYTGYKNAKFGKIEAHEAITAYSREALLRAKEAAEQQGFEVLHMYIDGLWIRKEGASRVEDFQPVLDEIAARTGLSIALDGVYKWVAFLPSRMDSRVPVANRYFGVFRHGEIKVRGIEARRLDTPIFIVKAQMDALKTLAKAPAAGDLVEYLPQAVELLRQRLAELRRGDCPVEQLLVKQKLSRELDEYRVLSPAARAVQQLEEAGKSVGVGQHVSFLFTRGEEKVLAWDLPQLPDLGSQVVAHGGEVTHHVEPVQHMDAAQYVDVARYTELFLRAASSILQPLGVEADTLRSWLLDNAGYAAPPGVIAESNPAAPIFSSYWDRLTGKKSREVGYIMPKNSTKEIEQALLSVA